jgi:hypothetical protein
MKALKFEQFLIFALKGKIKLITIPISFNTRQFQLRINFDIRTVLCALLSIFITLYYALQFAF